MYASGDTHGSLYKSVDSGNTWENLSSYGSYNAWCFEINPTRPDTIYAGSMMNEADSVGIRLSIDGGISWQTVLKWPAISQIAVSPSNPDIVYAAAGYWPGYQTDQHGEGIWKSTDGGFTWNKIITNLIDNMSIQTIAFNPSSPNAMYAGAYGVFGNGNGLYASLNGGTSWYLAGLANKHIWKIAVCNSTPNIIFAAAQDSVYKSSDYGTTWNAMNINIGVTEGLFFGLNISKSDNNIIYVGSLDKDIFKSTDAGLTWSGLMNSGLTSTRIWDVTVHPTNSNIVFAGQQGQGIWKSTDGASTWQDANTGFKCHYITDLHHTNGGVFAALYNEQGNNSASVRKWNGTSWNSIGLNDLWINKIVPVPGSTDTLFASKVDYGFFSGKPNNKLLKSTNSGLTWIPVGKGLDTTVEISTIKINHQNKNIIYAGNKLGIYKSANGGNDFTLLGLNNVTSISIHPVSTNIIYAGTWTGVYKSIDAGVNWAPLNTFSNAILSLAILSSNPKIIFAGSFANGILKSIDDGVTWNYVSTNLNGKTIFAILPDFFNPNIVYAGGTMGVYRSVSDV
ncbi:MAG: hypothetical protein HYU69_10635 [Bacteroidetes bacterium]|nr:hypothetical protein [Bacteroidota bacterium]